MRLGISRTSNRLIDPQILSKITSLQLISRTVVEGFLAGLHRSPYHGFSLDFAEYREYSPGDDIRGVDWKVFGRTDRFYVKKYEGETNTELQILLDTSASMGFSSGAVTKLDYARFLAASIAYLSMRQKDATGLMTFDAETRDYLPPRSRFTHFLTLLHRLEQLETGSQTNLPQAMEELASRARRRGVIIIISDLYHEVKDVARALRFFQHRGHDLILFHVLDPVEIEMPIGKIATLEDMEVRDHVTYVPEYSRRAYLELLRKHIDELRKECRAISIDYELLNTGRPLDAALFSYLSARVRKY
ncbi:MAG: DUF58 domain-containing protein [Acidobacteria bacterium]|nr:DUF58 domain-containing protein [Acidobacteriota bacterium]